MEIKLGDEFSQFSKDAKATLTKHVENYIMTLKDESERLAASRNEPDGKMTVTKSIVESMIGIHGHHVFSKPNILFTYVMPVLEAIAGGFFCNAFFKENKGWIDTIIMVGTPILILISIFLRHLHDSK